MRKTLPINSSDLPKHTDRSSNLLFRTTRPATMAGFDVKAYIGDTVGDTHTILYRDVKVNTTGPKWFVEFKHLIPLALRPKYQNRKWHRIKVYKDINIIKTLEYAQAIRKAVEQWLSEGYSPFKMDIEAMKVLNGELKEKHWTIQQALIHFKDKWAKRGLSPKSTVKYERTADRLIDWLTKRNMQHLDAKEITSEHIDLYMENAKEENKWENTTYNGERGFVGTIFNFLSKKKITSAIDLPDKLKQKSKKHKYYDDRTYKRLKEVLIKKDPYLHFAFEVVYYLCIRSEDELRNFKVGNIFPDRKQVFISGKTGERFVPMSKEILNIFKKRKIFDYPEEHYVFSVAHKNKFSPDGHPGPAPFGSGFFSKRFSKRRKEAKITSEYTIYGAKHTRVIHLKNDGARDSDIMSLTGHDSFEAYATYLRDLGITANDTDIHRLTRKI